MAVKEETALEISTNGVQPVATPMQMLALAVSQGADIDKLSKLMDLQERWEKNEARKAFVSAMNAFKLNPPKITKNKHVHYESTKGDVDYDHATLDHVCDQVTKALSEHGISHDWEIDDSTDMIKVTCVLTHELGHSKGTSMRGAADTTGSKNPLQARASTVSYLQRYTLLAACGLAAENADNDGRGVVNSELEESLEWLQNASSKDELHKLFVQAWNKFDGNARALQVLVDANKKKRQEFA